MAGDDRCVVCGGPFAVPDGPHASRPCEACGNPVYTLPGPDGLRVEDGSTVTIPSGFLKLSLDKAISSGRLFRPGVSWMVKRMLFEPLARTTGDMPASIDALLQRATTVLEGSERLADLDLDDEQQAGEAFSRIDGQDRYPEYWAALVGSVAELLKEALDGGIDPMKVGHLSQQLTFAWTMLVFTEQLEPFVWRGYQATGVEAMRALLQVWDQNKGNSDEAFWQEKFDDSPFVLSQVLPHPIVLVRGKAYVGGKTIDNTGGQITDYLLSQAATGNAALLELKTPTAKLLGAEYRNGVYAPSADLAGAVAQLLSQRDSLVSERDRLLRVEGEELIAFNPASIVLIGCTDELNDTARRKSFELYRSSLMGVTVLTYDELFRNVEQLLAAVAG